MATQELTKDESSQIVDDIVSITAAIAYAALTNRMEEATKASVTLHQLLHVATYTETPIIKYKPVTLVSALALAKQIASDVASVHISYTSWILQDTDTTNG